MIEGRCKTCKWWHSVPYMGDCQRCERADSEAGEPDDRFALMFANPWGYAGRAYVNTSPYFGCVMWEAEEGVA